MMHATLVLISIICGVLRFTGFKSQAYQAFSHLFVGGLIGAYIAGGDLVLLFLSIGLSIVELTAFVLLNKEPI
jgi:hypothetical protein